MTTDTVIPQENAQAENTLVVNQPVDSTMTLRDSVDQSLANYFSQLDGVEVKDVYAMVLSEVEAPLLEQTLAFCRNNQTKAAQILGLNRGTLRKKLKQYGLL